MKGGWGSKGLQDLNMSLALNPNLFQSYIARANYFGQTKRYMKAILNCNEAIQTSPKSVQAHLTRYTTLFIVAFVVVVVVVIVIVVVVIVVVVILLLLMAKNVLPALQRLSKVPDKIISWST